MRRLPPLHGLRAFEAAARHLHFSKAADELGLTPTAISHQVRQLEDILGVTLFRRHPRPVTLTPAGERLFPVLRDALDTIAGTLDQLMEAGLDAPLRISVTMAFASRWLMHRLPLIREETGLSISVDADDCLADLHASDIDMAIRYAHAPGPDAEWHHLFSDSFLPVCAPGLIDAAPPGSPGLTGIPLLHYRWRAGSNGPDWGRWHAQAGAVGPAPEIAQTFSEEIHAIDAAVAGQGAVLASRRLVGDLLKEGQLVPLSDIALPGPTYWAVFLRSHPGRARLERLVTWIRQQA